jgi:hypothetical protein
VIIGFGVDFDVALFWQLLVPKLFSSQNEIIGSSIIYYVGTKKRGPNGSTIYSVKRLL